MLDDVARRLAGQTHEIKHVEAILLRAKIRCAGADVIWHDV
jgi:hypothetical protein